MSPKAVFDRQREVIDEFRAKTVPLLHCGRDLADHSSGSREFGAALARQRHQLSRPAQGPSAGADTETNSLSGLTRQGAGGQHVNPIRVMVVDDSVVVRKIVTDVLSEDPDIEVVGTAVNGKIALAKLDQLKPDLVTMDIEMPEMNGIEAVRGIRAGAGGAGRSRVPIIMFSTL